MVRPIGAVDKTPRKTSWSDVDLDYIRENYLNKTNREIATHLGCSISTLKRKARELGLVKQQDWSKGRKGTFDGG